MSEYVCMCVSISVFVCMSVRVDWLVGLGFFFRVIGHKII